MKILQYHPTVEVYVACDRKNGSVSYYDLTEDVTSCRVQRNLDAPSTFSATFQNQNGKYNNLISPMDRVVIRAGKDGASVPLIAGYINSVDKWRLLDQDFTMTGTDVLYRLQKLYVDGGLIYNSGLFANSRNGNDAWGGYECDIYRWLVNVCNWPESQIAIDTIPQNVIEFAKNMYSKQREDIAGATQIAKDFRELLMGTGITPTSNNSSLTGPTSYSSKQAQYGAPKVSSAKGALSAEKRQIILNAGYSIIGTKYVFGGEDPYNGIDCSGFTQWCYRQAGIELTHQCKAQAAMVTRVSRDQLQPGDLIIWLGRFSVYTGDHAAIYVGNNQIIHSSVSSHQNGVAVSSLDGWPPIDAMGYITG